MLYLDNISPFVLAGIGSEVDTNVATAAGAFAAIVRTQEHLGLPSNCRVLVQGCGKVGSGVAKRLVNIGATVYTYDIVRERADIPGCTNVSDVEDWAGIEMDIFSPNAISGVITSEVAERLTCQAIVGAANVPFESEEARILANQRGIKFVPEYITSAGAIIIDSLEWSYEDFDSCSAALAYEFVYDRVYDKVGQFLEVLSMENKVNPLKTCHKSLTSVVSDITIGEKVVGSRMDDFAKNCEPDHEKWAEI